MGSMDDGLTPHRAAPAGAEARRLGLWHAPTRVSVLARRQRRTSMTSTDPQAPAPAPLPPPPVAPAARTVDLTKVYGKGEAAVRALDGITVEFARGQFTAV